MSDDLFRWDPPDWDPAWQAALDRIAPSTERGLDTLRLVWVPGDLHQPVQRWCIYQMTPFHRAPEIVRPDLLGPNPRLFGYWSSVLGKFVRERAFTIDRMQWVLFRETGMFGRLYWVIQGPDGGHRRRWDELEESVSIALGGPEQPPAPGDMPYAPFTERVLDKLRQYDLTLRFRNRLADVMADPDQLDREDMEREMEARKLVFQRTVDDALEVLTFTRAQEEEIMRNRVVGTESFEDVEESLLMVD